jgi:hypothetical protein
VGDTTHACGELVAAAVAQSIGLGIGNGDQGGRSVRVIRFGLWEEDGLALGLAWATCKASWAIGWAAQKGNVGRG